MISISKIHEFIRHTLRKNAQPFMSPADIDNAINRASTDLFNGLIQTYRKSDALPDLLNQFRTSTTVTMTSGTGTLSAVDPELIGVASVISGNEFVGKIAEDDREWLSRKFSDLVENPENPDDPLAWYIKTIQITDASNGLTLPSDFIRAIGCEGVTGGISYKGDVVSPEDYFSKAPIQDPIHLNIQRTDLALAVADSGVKDLPENYVEGLNIYFKDTQNNLREGRILSQKEFLDRVNSSFLGPDTNNPIATIYDNKIELYPRPAGSDIYNYVLVAYHNPVLERPIAKVDGNKVFARPIDTRVDFKYYAFPVEERPLVRYESSPSNTTIEVKPSNLSSVKVYYLSKPVAGVFNYSNSNGNIVYSASGSTDLDWDEKAFGPLVSRALTYMGISAQDPLIAQTESLVNGQ